MTESIGKTVVLTREILKKMGESIEAQLGDSHVGTHPRSARRVRYSSERIDPIEARRRLERGHECGSWS